MELEGIHLAAPLLTSMGTIKIRGRAYDKVLIEIARKAHVNTESKELTLSDIEAMINYIGPDVYTGFQKTTISYIRRKFKWSREADLEFRRRIRDYAKDKRLATMRKLKAVTLELR